MSTRGIRLNNPGNIRRGLVRWVGEAPSQPDAEFVAFTSAEFGFRALVKLLLTYRARGIDTLETIVETYAPASDRNDVPAYVADLAQRTGFHPAAPLDARDPETATALAYAITMHEQADTWPLEYHDALKAGVALAIGGDAALGAPRPSSVGA